MKTAQSEIKHALQAEYFYFVINDDLAQAAETINAIAHDVPTEHRSEAALAVAHSILDAINAKLAEFTA